MSSWKNANKSTARTHRERSQLSSRKHLGILEKKKDYKIRAIDYQKKKAALKLLKQKALDRNPDEFYFNMVRTEKKDGIHQLRESTEPTHTEDQLKLLYTQDQRYINLKRSSEMKKIERLKSTLHLIDTEDQPQNQHTIFVDSKKDVKNFDAGRHFNTHPSLVTRRYNRPTLESLQRGDYADIDQESILEVASKKKRMYQELKKRIEREQQLGIISQKMERKKQLLHDQKVQKEKVSEETKEAPAQYKWQFQRKR